MRITRRLMAKGVNSSHIQVLVINVPWDSGALVIAEGR